MNDLPQAVSDLKSAFGGVTYRSVTQGASCARRRTRPQMAARIDDTPFDRHGPQLVVPQSQMRQEPVCRIHNHPSERRVVDSVPKRHDQRLNAKR
jgi:hypothetical protein